MPKNCKGCIRYKLLTMYQYVQRTPSAAMLKGFFFGLRDQAPNALGAISESLLNFILAAQRSKAFWIKGFLLLLLLLLILFIIYRLFTSNIDENIHKNKSFATCTAPFILQFILPQYEQSTPDILHNIIETCRSIGKNANNEWARRLRHV